MVHEYVVGNGYVIQKKIKKRAAEIYSNISHEKGELQALYFFLNEIETNHIGLDCLRNPDISEKYTAAFNCMTLSSQKLILQLLEKS